MYRCLLLLMFLFAVSYPARGADRFQKLLDALDCDRKAPVGNMIGVIDAEAKDRQNYHPISVDVIPIKMRVPVKAYLEPTRGIFILIAEDYPTEQAVAKRVREYLSDYGGRIGDPDQKASVRCWARADGTRVYLLTTHAAMYRAQEELTHPLQTRLANYFRASASTPSAPLSQP